MKSSLITAISILFLATGCSVGNNDIIEGTTDSEIASCKLVKEYALYQESDITNFDQMECVFLDEYSLEEPTIAINLMPTTKHPYYDDYYDEEYIILVDPSLNTLWDKNISNGPQSLFIKDGDEFRIMTKEDAVIFKDE
jgi:hypothetical protein